MKFVRGVMENNPIFRMALPLLFALAGGGMFVVAMPRDQAPQILTLGVFGLLAACLLHMAGELNRVAFFAFGFSVVINPIKTFGAPPVTSSVMALSAGEAAYQFVTLFDLALLLLAALLFLGQLPGEGRPASRPIIPRYTKIGLAVFGMIALVSCVYAPSLPRAFAQIAFDCKLTAMMMLLSHIFSDRGRLRAYLPILVYGLLAACAIEFCIAILEYTGFLRIRRTILGIPLGMGAQELMAGTSTMFRISGTYGSPNSLGVAMAMAGLLIWELQLAIHPVLRFRKMVWAVWGGVILVFLLTMSRGAWVAMAAAVAVYFPFALRIQGKDWLHAFLRRYAFVSVFCAAVLITVLWQPLQRRLFHSNPGAVQSRVGINAASSDYVSKNPFFGGGTGNHFRLTENYPYIRQATRFSKAPMPAHNVYLYLMTEVGAVGTFFYILIPLGIFGSALRVCLKYPKDPLTPVSFAFANTFIVFWLSDCFSPVTRQIYCAYLFWMIMGIAAGTQRALGEGEESPDDIADVTVEVVGR